jgi:hypothetical protein
MELTQNMDEERVFFLNTLNGNYILMHSYYNFNVQIMGQNMKL